MKKQFIARTCLVAGLSVCSLALSPRAFADEPANMTTPSAASQDSKTGDSTAERHAGSTGTASTPAALERTDSKAGSQPALDRNPSTADTNSDEKSATKDPTGEPGSPNATANVRESKAHENTEQPMTDQSFLQKEAQGGMTEVELGKLAQEKATSADVKQFGSHMVMDHTAANNDLKTLAQQKGVTVPAELDAKHQATVDHFKHLSGAEFDRAYVHAMVKNHEKTVSDFQKEANSGQDADIKAFANKTLPTLQSHLTEVQNLQTKIK